MNVNKRLSKKGSNIPHNGELKGNTSNEKNESHICQTNMSEKEST